VVIVEQTLSMNAQRVRAYLMTKKNIVRNVEINSLVGKLKGFWVIFYSLRVNTPWLAAKEIVGFCSEYPAACGGGIYFRKNIKKRNGIN
jgi:hypothetical protein